MFQICRVNVFFEIGTHFFAPRAPHIDAPRAVLRHL
jgi:hypothetical protein